MVVTTDRLFCCPFCKVHLWRIQQTELSPQQREAPADSLRCPHCDCVWMEREGIPSFYTTDFYWGEISREEMQAILTAIQEKGWDEVVHRDLPRQYPDRYRYVFHPIRADWFYVGGIKQRKAALDLGAGWGGLSLRLSRLFDQVVAVEGVWERIKFASMLFKREGAVNIRPVHADIHALPLPTGSFDLVVMNGLLEWAALGGDEPDPERAQRNLLAKAMELLRPGGSLYIGIENRFALIFLAGGRDHNRPRWLGILPRPVASLSMRLLGFPERHPLTHSPAGYTRLLEGAGFEDIRFHCAFPSYSYPRVLIPLSHPAMLAWAARRSSDWRMDSLSLPARLIHELAAVPTIAQIACSRAESLVIWARRPEVSHQAALASNSINQRVKRSASRAGNNLKYVSKPRLGCSDNGFGLTQQVLNGIKKRWHEFQVSPYPGRSAGDSPKIAALQLSGNWEESGKIGWFIFENGSPEPTMVVKIARTATHGERIANEYQTLCDLRAMSNQVAKHIPAPLALWTIEGHLVSIQEYVPGRATARFQLRSSFLNRESGLATANTVVTGILQMCIPFLTHLARYTYQEPQLGQNHPYLQQLLDRAAIVSEGSDCSAEAKELLGKLIGIAQHAREAAIPVVAHHGDLNTFDILVSKDHFWITDWEWAILNGLPLLDLVTIGVLAAGVKKNECTAIPGTILALSGMKTTKPAYASLREITESYCDSLDLAKEIQPALVAAALLHSFVKGKEAGYAGARYISLSDSNPMVKAAHVLVESADEH